MIPSFNFINVESEKFHNTPFIRFCQSTLCIKSNIAKDQTSLLKKKRDTLIQKETHFEQFSSLCSIHGRFEYIIHYSLFRQNINIISPEIHIYVSSLMGNLKLE